MSRWALLAIFLFACDVAAQSGTFEEALAAYDEANASRDGEHPSYARAFAIWSELAEGGDAASRYHLGIMHMYGLGGALFDQAIAVRMIYDSATAGHYAAQSLMGVLSEKSDGTLLPRDRKDALKWYRKGAENGHCAAVRRMEKAYRNGGLGLAVDEQQAQAWHGRLSDCRKR